MPIIPNYNSQRNINANIQEPLRDEASKPFEDQNKIIGTMQMLTQKWSDANDVMQETKYKADTGLAIAAQEAAALNDPDMNNMEEHFKALNKIKSKAGGMISNKSVEQRAAAELEHNIGIAKIKIADIFKTKQHLNNAIELEKLTRTLAERKSMAYTVAEGTKIDNEFMDNIERNVSSGVITEAHGRKLIEDYRLGTVDLDIMKDTATTKEQSYVYDELMRGKDGRYSYLDDAERAERLEKVELHIRRNKIMTDFTTSQNQDENEKELLLNHGGNITETTTRNMLINTAIRKDFGNKFIKSMYAPPAQETDPAAYNRIKMMQLSGSAQREVNNAVLSNIGSLTPKDREEILNSAYDPRDKKTMTLRASAQALSNWAKSFDSIVFPGNESNEVVFTFLKRIAKNDSNPDEVMKEVQKDFIKKHFPDTTMLPDVPNLIGNRNRIKSVYQKESKASGKKAEVKPASSAYQSMNISFDDL